MSDKVVKSRYGTVVMPSTWRRVLNATLCAALAPLVAIGAAFASLFLLLPDIAPEDLDKDIVAFIRGAAIGCAVVLGAAYLFGCLTGALIIAACIGAGLGWNMCDVERTREWHWQELQKMPPHPMYVDDLDLMADDKDSLS